MSEIFGRLHVNKKPIGGGPGKGLSELVNFKTLKKEDYYFGDAVALGTSIAYNTSESFFEKSPHIHHKYKLVIASDARIDNRKALADRLDIQDHPDIPDSDFILAAYLAYDKDCTAHLMGAFSFAIWNPATKTLFCARDHMGVRPFFYYWRNDVFIFASTIKAITDIIDTNTDLDTQYVFNQVANIEQAPSATSFSHIKRLCPAHSIHLDHKNFHVKSYWTLDIEQEIRFKRSEDYVEAFLDHFDHAIKARTRSARNVGSELSGGLDSSGIAAVAQKHLKHQGRELFTFSNVMEEKYLGKVFPYIGKNINRAENQLIRDVCEMADIRHNVSLTSSGNDDFLSTLDNSFLYTPGLDEYKVRKTKMSESQAREEVYTMLSGFPGDELVTAPGYGHYLEFIQKGQLWTYIKESKRPGTSRFDLATRMLYPFLYGLYKIHPFIGDSISRPLMKLKFQKRNQIEWDKSFFSPAYLNHHPSFKEKIYTNRYIRPPLNFREMQREQILRPNTGLRMENENMSAMLNKAEYRYPLADIRLLQFVMSVPASEKVHKGQGRFLFRRAMKDIIPSSITSQPRKIGSTIPYLFMDYQKIHNQRIAWLTDALKDKRFYFLDREKLLTKAAKTIHIQDSKDGINQLYGRRQTLMVRLIRYHQLHPDWSIF